MIQILMVLALRDRIVVLGGAVSIALLTRVFHPTLVYLFADPLRLNENRCDRPEPVA